MHYGWEAEHKARATADWPLQLAVEPNFCLAVVDAGSSSRDVVAWSADKQAVAETVDEVVVPGLAIELGGTTPSRTSCRHTWAR
jgi:hypothetical protein